MSTVPSQHHYHLLAEIHDRIEDLEVYRGYLAEAKEDGAQDWVTTWQRLIDDAERQVEFMRSEVERLSR